MVGIGGGGRPVVGIDGGWRPVVGVSLGAGGSVNDGRRPVIGGSFRAGRLFKNGCRPVLGASLLAGGWVDWRDLRGGPDGGGMDASLGGAGSREGYAGWRNDAGG